MAQAVNQLNPLASFKSILRQASLPTGEKLAIAARLLRGKHLQQFAGELGITPQHLSRAINARGNQGLAVRRRAAILLGLELADIGAPLSSGMVDAPESSLPQAAGGIN